MFSYVYVVIDIYMIAVLTEIRDFLLVKTGKVGTCTYHGFFIVS